MLFDLVEAHGSPVLTDLVESFFSDFLLWPQVLFLKLFFLDLEDGLLAMVFS